MAHCYDVVLVDPPWCYNNSRTRGAAHHHYPVTSDANLREWRVPRELASAGAALLMWTTGPKMPESIELMKQWGFAYKTVFLVWNKLNPKALTPVIGLGHYTRPSCEFLLVGTARDFRVSSSRCSARVPQYVAAPRREHSRKPDEARALIEQYFGGAARKIELFAREAAPGWDAWGLESGKF